ncbi:MAG TPA: response regulator transcription factor [Candidatus Dorea gallistercoris]|uniref:Stage 0 sporulation protein A homolog n=1 Tax=Candidatus Dorea gallistercoris TaxID=2838542 RepID=A0A9D1UDL7_9FIRM|nr:response regulator transcription factor [Candidatus Dorea gallistercoris]
MKGNIDRVMIGIIDDDEYIGDMLEEILGKQGYGVMRAYSGTEALLLLQQEKPDLILLDLMLPGLSGEEVLPKIKDIPVIIMSAKGEVHKKVDLLLGGAADYVTKPFDVDELLARIQVQLRNLAKEEGKTARKVLSFDQIAMEPERQSVVVDGLEIHLTRTEFAILKTLLQNPSQVVTKSILLDRISQDTPDCTEESLKVHVSNLRKKLKGPSGKDYIEAVWGIGFKMKEM